jgi:short-subunit dehydrogenase
VGSDASEHAGESAGGFRSRYGPWAVVAGASEGLGAQFAAQLAAKGLNVVAVARRRELLDRLASEIGDTHGVEVRTIALDLSLPDAAATLRERTRDLEVGLVVYNAALSRIGSFLESDVADQLRMLDLNCRTPLILAHEFGREMVARGRGGLLLMSSMSGLQGSPLITTYAATKAFDTVLGEGLWAELRSSGVDVLAFLAGATRTPNYESSRPRKLTRFAPAVMEPAQVAAEALAALGTAPSAIAGRGNRLGSLLMNRLLPRRLAVGIMDRTTRSMYGPED